MTFDSEDATYKIEVKELEETLDDVLIRIEKEGVTYTITENGLPLVCLSPVSEGNIQKWEAEKRKGNL